MVLAIVTDRGLQLWCNGCALARTSPSARKKAVRTVLSPQSNECLRLTYLGYSCFGPEDKLYRKSYTLRNNFEIPVKEHNPGEGLFRTAGSLPKATEAIKELSHNQ